MMEDSVPAADEDALPMDEDEELIPGVGRQTCPWQRLRLRLPVEEDDDATDEDHEEEDEEDDGGAWPAGEGHSATLVGSRCFIYGGVDDRHACSAEMLVLDMTTGRWRFSTDGLVARAFHSATLVGSLIYIYGGTSGDESLAAVHCFDTETETWSEVEVVDGGGDGDGDNSTVPPPAFFFHSTTLVDNRLLVWGGTGGHLHYNNHLYSFDLATHRWSQCPVAGDPPSPRANHTATLVGSEVYFIGGFELSVRGPGDRQYYKKKYYDDVFILHTDRSPMAWEKARVGGAAISRRSGHIAEYFPEAFGEKEAIVVFGGRTKAAGQTFALNDTWSLCLRPRLRWVEQKFAADESLASPQSLALPALPAAALLPLPRRNHAGCRFGTKLVVIGGWSGRENYGQSLADVFLLETNYVQEVASTYAADMRQAMQAFFDAPQFSDLVFIVGDQRIHAHRAVVAARCPKLAAQLRCGLRESTSGEIAIGHHAYPVFRKLVEFLYTDRVEVEPDDALDLLQAADEYMLERLKALCEEVVAAAVAEDNVAQLLEAAERYGARRLRSACVSLVAARPQLLTSAPFLALPPTLLHDLRLFVPSS